MKVRDKRFRIDKGRDLGPERDWRQYVQVHCIGFPMNRRILCDALARYGNYGLHKVHTRENPCTVPRHKYKAQSHLKGRKRHNFLEHHGLRSSW